MDRKPRWRGMIRDGEGKRCRMERIREVRGLESKRDEMEKRWR